MRRWNATSWRCWVVFVRVNSVLLFSSFLTPEVVEEGEAGTTPIQGTVPRQAQAVEPVPLESKRIDVDGAFYCVRSGEMRKDGDVHRGWWRMGVDETVADGSKEVERAGKSTPAGEEHTSWKGRSRTLSLAGPAVEMDVVKHLGSRSGEEGIFERGSKRAVVRRSPLGDATESKPKIDGCTPGTCGWIVRSFFCVPSTVLASSFTSIHVLRTDAPWKPSTPPCIRTRDGCPISPWHSDDTFVHRLAISPFTSSVGIRGGSTVAGGWYGRRTGGHPIGWKGGVLIHPLSFSSHGTEKDTASHTPVRSMPVGEVTWTTLDATLFPSRSVVHGPSPRWIQATSDPFDGRGCFRQGSQRQRSTCKLNVGGSSAMKGGSLRTNECSILCVHGRDPRPIFRSIRSDLFAATNNADPTLLSQNLPSSPGTIVRGRWIFSHIPRSVPRCPRRPVLAEAPLCPFPRSSSRMVRIAQPILPPRPSERLPFFRWISYACGRI